MLLMSQSVYRQILCSIPSFYMLQRIISSIFFLTFYPPILHCSPLLSSLLYLYLHYFTFPFSSFFLLPSPSHSLSNLILSSHTLSPPLHSHHTQVHTNYCKQTNQTFHFERNFSQEFKRSKKWNLISPYTKLSFLCYFFVPFLLWDVCTL